MDIFSYMDCSLDLFQDLEGNVLLVTCYLNIDGAINSKVLMWKKKKEKEDKIWAQYDGGSTVSF